MVFIGITGLAVGVTLPMLVSFGQQLLPHGQRIASGLMMGVTWAFATPVAAGTIELFEHLQCPENSLYAFGAILGASSVLCRLLPAQLAHSIDERRVVPDREAKSISHS